MPFHIFTGWMQMNGVRRGDQVPDRGSPGSCRAWRVPAALIIALCLGLVMPALGVTMFSGQVLRGAEGVGGAGVTLYCSNNAGTSGQFVSMAATGPGGDFTLDGTDSCEFSNIVLTVPAGLQAGSAESGGGTVISAVQIQYALPLAGKAPGGNIFRLQQASVGMTCPAGCSCLSPAGAGRRFANPAQCTREPCGGSAEYGLMYCYREGITETTTVPPAANQPPVAVIAVDRYAGAAPLTVQFDGRQSYDPDGSIAGYRWDFGDRASGGGYVAGHQYLQPGTYTATLVVTDASGLPSGESTVTITVSREESEKKSAAGIPDVSFSPALPVLGDPLVITARYIEPVSSPCLDIIAGDDPPVSCSGQLCRALVPQYRDTLHVSVRYCLADGTVSELPVRIPVKTGDLCPNTDRDCDTIPNEKDNCPDAKNPEQYDSEKCCLKTPGGKTQYLGCALFAAPAGTEPPRLPELFAGDGVGDACDYCPCVMNTAADNTDPDRDMLGNACDTCPLVKNEDQKDSDTDGAGDSCDKCPGYPDRQDQDYDGEPDACDCNDGVKGPQETGWDCGGPCGPCDPCTITPLPARFDWRNWRGRSWVSPVKMPGQGACGACYAFAPIAGTETAYNIKENTPVMSNRNLSEQWYVSGGFGGCHGGFETEVLESIRNNGAVTGTCFPFLSDQCCPKGWFNASQLAALNATGPTHMKIAYNATTKIYTVEYCAPKCSQNPQCANPASRTTSCAQSVKIKGYHKVPADADSVKRALLCHGPLVAGSKIQVHAFLIVGWNDTMTFPDWKTTGGWVRKNSWGLGYGTKGYGNLPYDHPFTDFINETYWVEV